MSEAKPISDEGLKEFTAYVTNYSGTDPLLHDSQAVLARLNQAEAKAVDLDLKLAKVCIDGGYNICARCGDVVFDDDMSTAGAYKKKIRALLDTSIRAEGEARNKIDELEEKAEHWKANYDIKCKTEEGLRKEWKKCIDKCANLQEELLRVRTTQAGAAHAIDVARQEKRLDLIDGEHPAETLGRVLSLLQTSYDTLSAKYKDATNG